MGQVTTSELRFETANPRRPDGEPEVKAVCDNYSLQLKGAPNQPVDQCVDLPPFIRLNDDGSYQAGITDEQLLEILIDRSEIFQQKLPCPENEIALNCLKAALRAKQYRTELRRKAKVEGTHSAH